MAIDKASWGKKQGAYIPTIKRTDITEGGPREASAPSFVRAKPIEPPYTPKLAFDDVHGQKVQEKGKLTLPKMGETPGKSKYK